MTKKGLFGAVKGGSRNRRWRKGKKEPGVLGPSKTGKGGAAVDVGGKRKGKKSDRPGGSLGRPGLEKNWESLPQAGDGEERGSKACVGGEKEKAQKIIRKARARGEISLLRMHRKKRAKKSTIWTSAEPGGGREFRGNELTENSGALVNKARDTGGRERNEKRRKKATPVATEKGKKGRSNGGTLFACHPQREGMNGD